MIGMGNSTQIKEDESRENAHSLLKMMNTVGKK